MKKVASLVIVGALAAGVIYSIIHPSRLGDELESTELEVQPISTRKRSGQPKSLSRELIISQIPESLPMFGSPYLTEGQQEAMDVFRKLGVVDGEEALDYLMANCGNGASLQKDAGLPQAMAFAISVWMENDLEGAWAAFQGFLTGNEVPGISMFQWRDKEFYKGLF